MKMEKIRIRIGVCLVLLALAGTQATAQEPATREERYQALVEQYYQYYSVGHADSAEIALVEALQLLPEAPGNFLLRGNLAELMVARRDTVAAVEQLSLALGEQPGVEVLRVRRAELFEESGQYNEALLDLDQLVATSPEKEVRRFNRARVRSKLGLYDGAAGDLRIIIQNNEEAYLPRVALAKVEERRGELVEAERLLSYLIEAYPKTPLAYRRRAQLLMRQDRKAEALADIRKVINELTPVTYEDHIIRGQLWILYGEEESAKSDFEKALQLGATEKYLQAARREAEEMRKF